MLDDKTMVADTLAGVNGELTRYGGMIAQSCEMSQEEIYKLAREREYYVPAAPATQEEIDHVKSLFPQDKMF